MSFARRIIILRQSGQSNLNYFKERGVNKCKKIDLKNKSLRLMTTAGSKKPPSKLYTKIMDTLDPFVPQKMRPLWEHEAGPKTIFFWAPLMKTGLVIASLKDLRRAPDAISPRQSASLAVTGVLWARWSLIIIPKNYFMFYVNSFVFLTQAIQTTRALLYGGLKKMGV